jgi:hypothetical protein
MNDSSLIDSLFTRDERPRLDFESGPTRLDEDCYKARIARSIIYMVNMPREGIGHVVVGVICSRDRAKKVVRWRKIQVMPIWFSSIFLDMPLSFPLIDSP